MAWQRVNYDLRKSAGSRYHSYLVDPDADDSDDKGAKVRLLEILTCVKGIKYIPEAARATIYRQAAKQLAAAKDISYGWSQEVAAAQVLAQFGAHVPAIAFHEVYQEILAVWCGNYWGRSRAYVVLQEFMQSLTSPQILEWSRLFVTSPRVRDELFQTKPKTRAIQLLEQLRSQLTIQAHINEVDSIIQQVGKL